MFFFFAGMISRTMMRTLLIRGGITLTVAAGAYLAAGLLGLAPLELQASAWNNIRIIAGLSILGCLMAAVGYGNS